MPEKFDRKNCHWFMLTLVLPNSQNHCHQGGGPQKEEGVELCLGVRNNKLPNYVGVMFLLKHTH